MKLFGALEAGGTKMVCAIGDENGNIIERVSIPTRTPAETMPEMIEFFRGKGISALGIGCFGPVDLDRNSPTYGYITSTPKLAWTNYPIVAEFEEALGIPVGFDTDVNAAALGEATWGCTKDVKNSIYITIGTGIGVGVIINGKTYHGMIHPEGGHILLARHPYDPLQRGNCPFHENCPAHDFTVCYHAEATEGQNLDLHWELLEGGILQVDAYKENPEDPARPGRAFSVQVLY